MDREADTATDEREAVLLCGVLDTGVTFPADWVVIVDPTITPRHRCACGKAVYATEVEAGKAVKRMRRRGRDQRRTMGLLIPYMCPERKGIWHVGHTDE